MCTSNCQNHRHSILCILPPHILENIIKNGDDDHREWALHTLSLTAKFQGRREAMAELPNMESVVASLVKTSTAPGLAAPGKLRTIYNAKHSQTLPGTKVRSEGGPASSDVEVNEAYDGAGATYDFYFNILHRNSVDDKGLPLNSSVHYGVKYDNAFWNGNQMVYGDGDGRLFNRFTIAIDVIGHELTHGVTQYTAALNYQDQSGALNESMSDVFGSMVKQYHLKQTAASADWLIGQGLLAPGVKGVALRSMKAPGTAYNDPVLGKDPQPSNMSGYVNTTSDNGGVHINSGIPNHAFFLLATALGGNSWDKAGQIWYHALLQLHPQADFTAAAKMTKQVAGQLYGANEVQAVVNAWKGVGISV